MYIYLLLSFVILGVFQQTFSFKISCASNFGLWEVLVNNARRLKNRIQKKVEYKRCLGFNDYSLKILKSVMISA
jgi:hypothetical protein